MNKEEYQKQLAHKPSVIDYHESNKRLLAAGFKWPYTFAQRQEWEKCSNDPIYFIKNYVKIVHVDKGLIPFKLHPFQEEFINILHNNRFSIAKWPRQSGKCLLGNTKYNIRNKKTGEILNITAEEFHNLNKNASREAGTSTSFSQETINDQQNNL